VVEERLGDSTRRDSQGVVIACEGVTCEKGDHASSRKTEKLWDEN